MNRGTVIQPPMIQQVGGRMVMFIPYYWEIWEDGKRAEWGFDSLQGEMPANEAPNFKGLEQQLMRDFEKDKVVILTPFPIGMTGGIPAVIGGLN